MIHKLLIAVSNGFQLRLLFHSGVVKHLQNAGINITVVASHPLAQPDELGSGIDIVPINVHPSNRIAVHYQYIRRFFLWPRSATASQTEAIRRYQKAFPQTSKFILNTMSWLPWRLKLRLHETLRQDKKIKSLLAEVKPDAVLLCSPGFSFLDDVLLNEAKRQSIRTIVLGQSWDNFSTKGYVHPKPDLMICWGKQMHDEAVQLQDFDAAKTTICGAPHFDTYSYPQRFGTREEIFTRFGLDPLRKLIVYGTSPDIFSSHEFDVVSKLAEWVNFSPSNNMLGYPAQLAIRLSPQEVIGPYATQNLSKYDAISGPYVRIVKPLVRASGFDFDLMPEDQEVLGALIVSADVVGNLLSTFTLDGVAAGKPTFCAVFDGDVTLAESKSCRRYLKYTHIQSMLSTGGAILTNNYTELQSTIQKFFANPDTNLEHRNLLVSQQLFQADGKSSERVAKAILEFLNNVNTYYKKNIN